MNEPRIVRECPYDTVNWLSKLTFYWLLPLFKVGYSKDLELEDLHRTCRSDHPRTVADSLDRHWQSELKQKVKPSLLKAIGKTFGRKAAIATIPLILTECILRVGQPLIVGYLVRYFSDSDSSETSLQTAWLCAAYLTITSVIYAFVRNRFYFISPRQGMNVRSSLNILIYQKILRLSKSSLEKTSSGQVLNILANDLQFFEHVSYDGVYLIVAPVQSIVCICIMWQYLGVSCMGGIVILLLFVPFQGAMERFFEKFRRRTTLLTDKRIKLMSELISAMKLIKVYCWEKPFADVVHDVRRQEISAIKSVSILNGLNLAINFVGTRIMLFTCFVLHIFIGRKLDAETVFVTMSLFNVLGLSVTGMFPYAIGSMAECFVATSRVQAFLLLEEKELNKGINVLLRGSVRITNFSGKWNKTIEKPSLKNINIITEPGDLTVIIGSIGAGKTCLLYALLNEIEPISGLCSLNGTISYSPQESWTFTGSIRENILLGKQFDSRRYREVLKVCALERDMSLFPNGDQTLVGEKGYTLSGGQKARVTLARAVYNEADVYLLDDPLSAVDPHVAKHIFEQCIKSYLKHKTVILVTHQLQFIKSADKIVLMDSGTIVESGNYSHLTSKGVDFLSFINKHDHEVIAKTTSTDSNLSHPRSRSNSSSPEKQLSVEDVDLDHELNAIGQQDEVMTTGSIKGIVYWNYIRAGANSVSLLMVFILLLASQALFHYTDFWLAQWTEGKQIQSNSTRDVTTQQPGELEGNQTHGDVLTVWQQETSNLIVYSVLMGLLFLSAFAKTLSVFCVCLRSSIKLHNRVFQCLLRAPMLFFENNPMGRILNRCTRDMGQIDLEIPYSCSNVSNGFINSLGIVLVSAVVLPYLIIPAIVLTLLVVPIRGAYIRTARDLRRLDAITKSPLYSHITTSFEGLTTVRAFGLEHRFEKQFENYLCDAYSSRFASTVASRALAITLDLFTCVYIFLVCAVLVACPEGIPGGAAGLALSSSLMLIGLFQYTVRESAEFENQMVSVERILEYGRLESEPELESKSSNDKMHSWPKSGEIVFKDVNLIYPKCSAPILNGINFRVNGGQKIGIVGRTGAGKSSLITVLFRLAEPQGQILIDGIDTKTLGLHELRNKISIIPQDPVLFSGTVRRNLDPFNEYQDVQLWKCLKDANLNAAIKAMDGQLEGLITEGGSNLSVGQRQLLCLARALLKNNKILVLDEATANVDHETDELIQTTIKSQFQHCTVLTVAHRLNTIIDMDKVIVLDAGQVIEFDAPYQLLIKQPIGLFNNMVKQTGSQFSKLLFKIAEETYFKGRSKSVCNNEAVISDSG